MDMDFEACRRAFQTRDARFDGRIFCGVKTTGVYCRPICPARTPNAGNVEFFPSAAAAQEAGYRPCLRCRPEASPDLGAWRGTSNTVSRALALIEGGALDAGDVDGLALRLGVGERQLRRLFRQHLGASPVSVAQTRRVLLAKQLIQETRLPMGEVALASGFGSVRRFNETFQQLFGRPPGELRRSRRAETPAADGIVVRLPYKPPYDWDAIIRFLADRAIPGVERVEARRYARTLSMDGERGVVIVTPRSDGALQADIRFPKLKSLPAVIARVRRVFDLSADPVLIGAHLSQDPALAPLVAARPGLRAPGAWDGFELAVRAILGQQVSVGAARNLAARLVEAYGDPIDEPAAAELGLTRVFPTPGRLIGEPISLVLNMPRARGAAIEALARTVVEDPAIFTPRADLDSAIAALKALPGVGEWTAHYVALREFREPDAFPGADVGLLRAMADDAGVRPTADGLLARSEAWRPWRAYAAQHLWAADPALAQAGAPARKSKTKDKTDARHAA
ncbi:AlkA N-terminal domain-containing protein [Phenylobacterium sp.]|uniref:AlkA N-terminal domain-containing protein n=1 Tax=Phenylobacterium sp. TaxID=1871053 RepID=UPI0025F94448|nr:AlkA N-terminal domain-containing protein [Phenylobacterium sp.]MBX3483759.1 helix-turn-helix domain-containing protein [Phenylobacterium sp.]